MKRLSCCLMMLFALTAFAPNASAQGGLVGKLREKAQQKKDSAVDKAAENAVNAAANSVRCAAGDKECIRKAKEAGKEVQVTDAKGKPVSSADSISAIAAATGTTTAGAPTTPAVAASADSAATGASSVPPGKGVWLNYDFIPGDRVIWWEDFSGDEVGDFPRRMKLISGNFEVVKIKGHSYLHTTTGGWVYIELPENLPERFTVEVHYWAPSSTNPLKFAGVVEGGSGGSFGCTRTSGYAASEAGPSSESAGDPVEDNAFVDCRFTVDSRYVKAYVNTKRVANNPVGDFTRGRILRLELPSYDEGALVTDIRVAAGGKKLYDLLAANGRVSTQGILFDTGSDRIRGESTPTLKEIGEMLQQHADLKLTIEGHTDNVGSEASNLALSERRAAAVKAFLVSNYAIDAVRLASKGFGASKPLTPNTTAEGRQNNRRVELVRN